MSLRRDGIQGSRRRWPAIRCRCSHCGRRELTEYWRGFTLLEVLLTVSIIAAVAAIVLPMFNSTNRVRVMAAASILASDIELAQVMTISSPNNPMVVRFDPATHTYWLARASDTETPILRDGSKEPYLVTMGQGRAVGALGVWMTLDEMPGDMLGFNAQGGLADFTSVPAIRLDCGGSMITLTIAPTTGTIIQKDGEL